MQSRELIPGAEDIWRLLLLGVTYYLLARLSLHYALGDHRLPIVWPAAGLGMAALIRRPGLWPAIAAAAFLSVRDEGLTTFACLATTVGDTGECLLGALLLRRIEGFDAGLFRLGDYLRLTAVGALAAPTLGAIMAAGALVSTGAAPPQAGPDLWVHAWMANALGILTVAPLILCWKRMRWHSFSPARQFQAAALALAIFAIGTLLLADTQIEAFRPVARPYLMFPLAIWAALSFGRRGVTLANAAILTLTLADASRGYFAGSMAEGRAQFWLFGMVINLTGMALATLLTELRRTESELRQRTEALRESEARFRSMADFANVLIWIAGPDLKRTWFNRAWLKFTGRRLDQELGDRWCDGVHPDDLEHCLHVYRDAFEARHSFELEYRLRHHDGEYRWILDNGGPRYDDSGFFLGYAGSCWDVTGRKQAEAALVARENELRSIYDTSHAAIFFVDADGRISNANRRTAELFHTSQELLRGRPYLTLLSPGERPAGQANVDALMSRDIDSVSVESRYQRGDGTLFWGHLMCRRLVTEDGETKGLVGVLVDVGARKEAEAMVNLSAKVFEASREGIMITDAENRIVNVNRAFTDITGYTAEEVLGRNPRLLASGRHPPAFYLTLWQHVLEDGHWEGEIWNRHKDGHVFPEWLSISTVYGDDGRISHHIGIAVDITERKATEEHVRHLAQYDYLTDLPNRMLLLDRLTQSLAGARRYDKRLALLFIDLDNFKPINDTYGHTAGDIVLREVAQRLRDNVREADTVSRQGGDEFVIVVSEFPDTCQVLELAEKLLRIISEPCLVDGHALAVTSSIGVSIFPDDGDNIDTLMRNADAAMYRAKSSGRNVVCFHDCGHTGLAKE